MKAICPFSGYDDTGREACNITKRAIESADELAKCDFEYDQCEIYARAQNKEKIRRAASTAQR